MKVLITGGAGYIGSVLTSYLLRSGANVTGLDSLRYGGESVLGFIHHPNYAFVQGDIRDVELLEGLLSNIDTIVHLASLVGDRACDANPSLTRRINVDGTRVVVDAAQRVGISRLLFASTASCYGANPDGIFADESSVLNPLTLYAETKVEAEQIILNAGYTVGRFATVYGLSARMRFDLILNQFALEAFRGDLCVYNPAAWRSHIHVWDLARAICVLLGADDTRAQVFNVGGHNRRKLDLVNHLQTLVGFDVDHVEPGTDSRDYQVNFDGIRALGFTSVLTPENGCNEIITSLQDGVFMDKEKYINW
jgi:nucleoside-diphosphate-sugar epimerase